MYVLVLQCVIVCTNCSSAPSSCPCPLALTLKRNLSLTYLDLYYCGLQDDGVCHLAEGLHGHPSLQTLILRYNPFGERGGMAIAGALGGGKTGNLQTLKLGLCHSLGAAAAVRLVEALETNTTLRELVLPDKYCGHVTRSCASYNKNRDRVRWS